MRSSAVGVAIPLALAKRCSISRWLRYVHSANEPLLIAGVGTYALEIFDEWPEVEVVLVPIGGGSGAAGLVERL